ncbi:uncharacterized protein LOC120265263 [Dioscorea cayenensis subsp. rotundata]|uniref:Uncharacterized protein LOC120265263 n=1 Tax=Dioscorea cayennensis subsp. rotundata TaxID=55577 RepID=A0AB40BNP3_DIOCR|nr:uncharacterized protein LOC120265263 [Dioscorea cayenensis subsp. rotundata]
MAIGVTMSLFTGTIVDLETRPRHLMDLTVRDARIFHRVFWSFPACVEAFKYCKPVVQIDSTHIYGKYKGTLLLAITQDGNKNILPIGFAIVEGETLGGWTFFLRNLRSSVTPQQGICFISDRHESIKSAFRSLGREMSAPHAYHVYCIRHISANFMRRFRNKEMQRIVVNIGYSKTIQDFNYWYGLLRDNDEEATRWLDNIPREKWAQAFDKEGRRYGHMTTNLAECVNSVLKGTRNLSITAMVKSTYFRLAELFVRKGVQVQAQIASGLIFSESLMKAIQENQQAASSIYVRQFDREEKSFMVDEMSPPQCGRQASTFRINLRSHWCDCGAFQTLHFPCRHVLAACSHIRLHWEEYVDNVYRLQTVFNVYHKEFEPISNKGYWNPYNGPRLCPNITMRRPTKGRPKSTRIRNEMDIREGVQRKRCGLCRNEGYSRRNCPNIAGSSTRS